MIVDIIDNLSQYFSLNSSFEDIDRFIQNNNLKDIDCGSYDICDGVKVSITEYEPGAGGDYECHRCFYDLQYAITGNEIIEVVPTKNCINSTGYKPDIEFYTDKTVAADSIVLNEGTFAFLAPGDAHKPCIKAETQIIKKAVFKIRIEN